MLFELKDVKNKKLEKGVDRMMSELNDFYEINWVFNVPKIFFVDNRKQIDDFRGEKTNGWLVGWTRNGRDVYVLKNERIEKESLHKKLPEEEYSALIKHELSHCFQRVLSDFCKWIPKWLWEGLAIYTSGQNSFKKKVNKFETFLDFYDQGFSEGIYKGSGFAVELLVNKFGKEKLLSLIKNLKNYQSKELFEEAFEKEYCFFPNYKNFNSLM